MSAKIGGVWATKGGGWANSILMFVWKFADWTGQFLSLRSCGYDKGVGPSSNVRSSYIAVHSGPTR